MNKIAKSEIVRHVLQALLTVAGRRESELFAVMAINSLLQMISTTYDFMKCVTIKVQEGVFVGRQKIIINVSSEIFELVPPSQLSEGIESLIRLVVLDMNAKAGLYFLKEFKEKLGSLYLSELRKLGVNLGGIQLEQHCLLARSKREDSSSNCTRSTICLDPFQDEKRKKCSDADLFGFNWRDVTTWEYDEDKREYILYDKDDNEIITCDLDTLVNKLTKLIENDSEEVDDTAVIDESKHSLKTTVDHVYDSPSSQEIERDAQNSSDERSVAIEVTKKEYQFLEMLYEQDLDATQATELLQVSMNDLEYMVKRLLKFGLMKYVSEDEVELSQKGIDYLISLYSA